MKAVEEYNLSGKIFKGEYKIIECIVRGKVYKAYDLRLGKEWIVELVCSMEQQGLVDAWRRKAETLMKLDYPEIPRIVDAFEYQENLYSVRSFVKGQDLQTIVNRHGLPMPQNLIVRMGIQIADILIYLHSQTPPIVHRDVKPANIVWTKNGDFRLIDFGIAMEYDWARTDDFILGTRGYAPPEQYEGRSSPQSDIYALGVTMHYLATGIDPLHFNREYVSARSVNPYISKKLDRVIDKCTKQKPEKRYVSAERLKHDLGKIYGSRF